MTKLTTEITIEELQYRIHAHENDLTQMWTADYFLNVQKELLALKQAAKNPVAWTDSDELEDANKGYSAYLFGLEGEANKYADPRRKIMLYAAPVLPKQPELLSIGELLHRLEEQTGEKWVEEFAQPVSEPYKLNGWISVADRLPSEFGRYLCYVEEQNDLGKSHYQWNCSWNGDVFSDSSLTGRVTHWMPLPAAPSQESE